MKTKTPEGLLDIADELELMANHMLGVAKLMCAMHGNKIIKLHGRELRAASKLAGGWAKKIRNPPKPKPEWEQFRDSCS